MIDFRITPDETIQAHAIDTPSVARFYESGAFPGSLSIFLRNTEGQVSGLRLNVSQVTGLRDALTEFISKHS